MSCLGKEDEDQLQLKQNNWSITPPLSPAQILSHFRAQNVHVEAELFARIHELENLLVYGLPPQRHPGEYANLVRENLNEALNIRHYQSALTR